MTNAPAEFGAGQNKHQRVVDTMQHEKIPKIRNDTKGNIAFRFKSNAPIQSYSVNRNGESTEPKRNDIHRHGESGTSFESTYF